MRLVLAVLLTTLILSALTACQSAQVQTVPLTPGQLQALREIAQVTACPQGKYSVAGVVETPSGGAVLTLKCDLSSWK